MILQICKPAAKLITLFFLERASTLDAEAHLCQYAEAEQTSKPGRQPVGCNGNEPLQAVGRLVTV